MECAGRAKRRRRFGHGLDTWDKPMTANESKAVSRPLATALQSISDAHHSCFAFEVLQSRGLTLAAAVLPVCPHVFRICVRSDSAAWRAARKLDGFAAALALSSISFRRI